MSEEYDGKPDETGTLFVDILFALVVTQILTPLKDPEKTTFLGGVHLLVAFVLTLLSWIGYHNSRSRADARLRFPTYSRLDARFGRRHVNDWHYYSISQFALDVAMVVVYWMASITYERSTADMEVRQDLFWYWPSSPSAFPEALAIVASFGLYWLWDAVGRSEADQVLQDAEAAVVNAPDSHRAESRRRDARASVLRRTRRKWPTQRAWALSFIVLALAFVWRSWVGVLLLDGALILLLVWYRYAKEFAVADLEGA